MRTEPAPRKRARGPIGAVLALAVVALVAAAAVVVVPVATAQASAADADDAIRTERFDVAARLLRDATYGVPYNADYPFRAARAMLFAGRPAPEVESMLDIAVARDPTGIGYYLTRAHVEMRQPQPDVEQVRKDYDRVLSLNPNDVQTRLNYAAWLADRGLAHDAVAQYRTALKKHAGLHPDEPKRLPPERLGEIEARVADLEKTAPSTKPS
jgi:thioredoxin-like negative regulator of GroEL